MAKKAREAFRTISEVADWLDVPAHVLRFWESKFVHIKPVKRAGGRRYYRPDDMRLIGGIKKLLHDDGLTIRGVQKILKEEGAKHVIALSPPLDTNLIDTGPKKRTSRKPARALEKEPVQTTPIPEPPEPKSEPAAPQEPPAVEEPLLAEQLDLDIEDKLVPSPAPLIERAQARNTEDGMEPESALKRALSEPIFPLSEDPNSSPPAAQDSPSNTPSQEDDIPVIQNLLEPAPQTNTKNDPEKSPTPEEQPATEESAPENLAKENVAPKDVAPPPDLSDIIATKRQRDRIALLHQLHRGGIRVKSEDKDRLKALMAQLQDLRERVAAR